MISFNCLKLPAPHLTMYYVNNYHAWRYTEISQYIAVNMVTSWQMKTQTQMNKVIQYMTLYLVEPKVNVVL